MELNRREKYDMDDDIIIRRLDRTKVTVGVWENGKVQNIKNCPDSTSYIAIQGTCVIGALTIVRKKRKDTKTVKSRATGVRPSSQRQGVAKALWTAMIKTEKPTKVIVVTVSDRGYTLIDAMKDAFPRIKWAGDWRGNRSLRKKKRG